jgi:membrane dipeptidase
MRATRAAAAVLSGVALACARPPAPDAALALHRQAIVVDTHSDTTPWFEDPDWDFSTRHGEGHEDLPRMREGGLDVQFWSIYLPDTPGPGRAIRTALERIDAVQRMSERHADATELARTRADVERIVAGGRIASLMGVEGGHIIEDSLAALRTFHRLGVRYMTLTHSFHTAWADSSGTDQAPAPRHRGLTPFGEEVVREMNRLGMMVDVSHVSDDTFWHVLRTTRAPVIASHSACRAVADHPRNLSDDMLRALAANGGVVMINFYPGYLDPAVTARARELGMALRPRLEEIGKQHEGDPVAARRARRALLLANPFPRTPLETLLRHFDHAIAVAGADHVGIGGDWDGVPSMPEGMGDVSQLPELTRALLARGHPPDTVRKVLGANLLRVMGEVERIAAEAPRAIAAPASASPR